MKDCRNLRKMSQQTNIVFIQTKIEIVVAGSKAAKLTELTVS